MVLSSATASAEQFGQPAHFFASISDIAHQVAFHDLEFGMLDLGNLADSLQFLSQVSGTSAAARAGRRVSDVPLRSRSKQSEDDPRA